MRRPWVVLFALAGSTLVYPNAGLAQAGVDLDTIRAGRFDNGKMWTFEYAPKAYFSETYGFVADDAWFERARLSALRIPGCSSSFVSPHGLMVTNHHCVRGAVSRVMREGETLLDSGFVATTLDEERPIPGYYADQLIAVEDVSDEVFAAVDRVPEAERAEARVDALRTIELRLRAQHAGLGSQIRVQIIGLYNGGRYSAYVFRRFSDIRLVAAAELQMGFFGGDPDNFTYPRYALDFAFLRVYEDGEPYRTSHYFGWGTEGVEEGDVVFVIGNPGPTNRLATVAQLEFQRDVLVPAAVGFLGSRLTALRDFQRAFPAEAEALDLRNRSFSLSNSLKANTGRLAALRDPTIMVRRLDAERTLRETIATRPDLQSRFGAVFDRLATIQRQKREWARDLRAFYGFGSSSASAALERRAAAAFEYLEARRMGATLDTLVALRAELERIPDFPRELEHALLTARLADYGRYLGADDPITRAALGGQAPSDAATALLERSVLRDQAGLASAIAEDRLTMQDPAVRVAAQVVPRYAQYQAAIGGLLTAERELAEDLGRARFAVYGGTAPPDASSSPRITDGVVLPYEYNGTLAPVYTTFFGVYNLFHAFGPGTDWDLPYRWRTPPAGLDLGTPLNFISTADTYGGNSGSPAVTKDLAIVGVNFDRNIQGLSRDFIYLPERGRNIMVDVRAIQAALDHVYDADRILMEATTGTLYRTEAEADAARR